MPHAGVIRNLSASAGRSVSHCGSGPALANVPEAARAEKATTIAENPGPEVGGEGVGLR